ncbi:MAG: isoaspartyl peptidase/L-asparaginase [Melioribacter sp.]|nr:isoaspartyl peptidase/L-asparaginase [Melioribacter sp.]
MRIFIRIGAIFLFLCSLIVAQTSKFGIAIHGGAGLIKNLANDKEKEYISKLEEALITGYKILENNGSAVDAITSAIAILEDSPLFNAGKGAVLNENGIAELDASIMDGKTLKAGAVAGVHHVKNPIKLAKLIMEKSPHVMMIGSGAEEFGKMFNIELVDSTYFITKERWEQYLKMKDTLEKHGTVGAVALDKNGNLAAGTSTGGMMMKKFGRVGDSPIIGAGTYANNNTCAVSCTGHGEYFIRLGVAKDISSLIEYKNMSLNDAANEIINKLSQLGGTGGVIAIDKYGNIAMPFNTEGMFRGYYLSDGKINIKIYK